VTRPEFPADPQAWAWDSDPSTPSNPMQALMEAMPGHAPLESRAELQGLREAIVDCIDQLKPEHRFIIEAIQSERISFSALATRLGVSKTHAHRLHEQALAAVRPLMLTNPTIRERLLLTPTPTWNEAARTALLELAPSGFELVGDALGQIVANVDIAKRRIMRTPPPPNVRIVSPIVKAARYAATVLEDRQEWNVDDMVELLCSKQSDYGHGNILAFGLVGLVVRLSDKVARLTNLEATGRSPWNESVLDTYRDIVGYAVIAQMLRDDTFILELADAA
jgi:hypothetical protein